MRWDLQTRYKILLEINNAVITQTTREDLFQALAAELREHFACDRLSINLYDPETQSISYFANAVGINPDGIASADSRPIAKGTITQMVIRSRQPVIIDDLSRYSDHSSIGAMVRANLRSTMAFPLTMRNRILGSINFSFRQKPAVISELIEVLTDVSRQIAIAVENMLNYTRLKLENNNLVREKQYLLATSEDRYPRESFIFVSEAMADIIELIHRIADTDVAVLLVGETGTGKDYLARYIHNTSLRREHLFVKTNCPALASSLFESELFGHAKGAFTGASAQRAGRFEMANGGTIFLDEIGELPISLQAKLLNVLQDRRFERVGETRPVDIDLRIISATNRDLESAIENGQFRRDLYYRLNTVTIEVPPLRERLDDIPLLINRISQMTATELNRPAPVYTPEAIDCLCQYAWPGNVRELKNVVKRMVILRPGEEISADEINKVVQGSVAPADEPQTLSLAEAERRTIEQALRQCNGMVGSTRGAAHLLGIPRSTLQYRIKKLGINPKDFA